MAGTVLAVVGAGPVGVLAALELARFGLSVVLLEAQKKVSWTSRAICISRRSLEILDCAGIGEAFRQKSQPLTIERALIEAALGPSAEPVAKEKE